MVVVATVTPVVVGRFGAFVDDVATPFFP